jgi:hypothetical protein
LKRKDWFIAGGLVAIGIILLVVASIAMQPMGMNMGMMMVWAMFVPWIVLIILFLLVACFGRWVVLIVSRALGRHECPSCGLRIRSKWKICPNCGSPLRNSKKAQNTYK